MMCSRLAAASIEQTKSKSSSFFVSIGHRIIYEFDFYPLRQKIKGKPRLVYSQIHINQCTFVRLVSYACVNYVLVAHVFVYAFLTATAAEAARYESVHA